MYVELCEFIARQTPTILTYTVRSIRRRKETERLRKKLESDLGIMSLTAGIGISEEMMEVKL